MRRQSRFLLLVLLVPALFGGLALLGWALGNTDWLEVVVISAFGVLMLLWVYEWGRDRRRPLTRMPDSALCLDCAVVPRRDCTAEELKHLGAALSEWWESEWAGRSGGLCWVDGDALNDLLAGELPLPFGLRLLSGLRGMTIRPALEPGDTRLTAQEVREVLQRARDTYPALAHLIPRAEMRAVFFGVGRRDRGARRQLISGLRDQVPAGLIEHVLIDGRSWDEE
jgi:hypothetical protein